MAEYNDSDHSSDSEEERSIREEVRRSIKEQDDFDNFLNAYDEASEYYNFYFLKWVPAYKVYSLIKDEFVRYPGSNVHKMAEEGDYYWCCELIYAADPETEITESKIYYFYIKMMNLSYLNESYLKKNKLKLPTKPWKVVTGMEI